MFKKRTQGVLLAITLLFGIGACSSTPKLQEFATTASPVEELQRFTQDMTAARDAQADVLAPVAFKNADKSLASATLHQKNGKDAEVVLHEIAVGRAYLDHANKSAAISRTNLEAVVTARLDAIKAGAPALFAKEFNNADDHLRSVTSEIEDNDLGEIADNRVKLQKEYLDVELKAIKHTNLGPSLATIAAAVKEGAKEYAKQSLAIAERNVTDTDAFIVANRHSTEAVKARADATTRAANHLLKITRASKAGKNVSSEQAALALESEQLRTQATGEQLSAERTTAKELALEAGDLKSADKFNRSFEAARKEFSAEEAEVYRQANKLVLRLKSLEFPANQSVLRGGNFPLLAKVAKEIKGFENSTVVIEGHTDSDGGKEANIKLSAERAQAISDYLVSNGAIAPGKITVMGYGYERPLASNKTAKGKAQNRRVDVVISPQVVTE